MSLEAHLQLFDAHDVQFKRSLPKKEVANVLRSCGRLATPKEMEALLKPYPDMISRVEFAELVSSLKSGPKESDLLTAFQAFDHKELGTLSRVELTSIMTQMQDKISTSDLDLIVEGLPFNSDDRVAIDAIVRRLMMPLKSVPVRPRDIALRMNS